MRMVRFTLWRRPLAEQRRSASCFDRAPLKALSMAQIKDAEACPGIVLRHILLALLGHHTQIPNAFDPARLSTILNIFQALNPFIANCTLYFLGIHPRQCSFSTGRVLLGLLKIRPSVPRQGFFGHSAERHLRIRTAIHKLCSAEPLTEQVPGACNPGLRGAWPSDRVHRCAIAVPPIIL